MKTIYFSFLCILFLGCTEKPQNRTTHILPMDSSMKLITEVTGLLADSCLPNCWPRDFRELKPVKRYRAYIWQTTISRQEYVSSKIKLRELDSAYSFLEKSLYALPEQPISNKDVSMITNPKISFSLVSTLQGKFEENILGFIHFSPVLTDSVERKGIFMYELQGDAFIGTYLVEIEKKDGKWKKIKQILIKVS